MILPVWMESVDGNSSLNRWCGCEDEKKVDLRDFQKIGFSFAVYLNLNLVSSMFILNQNCLIYPSSFHLSHIHKILLVGW